MTINAQIAFQQLGSDPGAGIALLGVTGEVVTCRNGDDTGVVSWAWTLKSVPIDSALTAGTNGTNPTFQFTPDAEGGCYLIRLTIADANGNTSTDERVFGVPDDDDRLVPAFQGTGAAHNFAGNTRGCCGTSTIKMIDWLLLNGGASLPAGEPYSHLELGSDGTTWAAQGTLTLGESTKGSGESEIVTASKSGEFALPLSLHAADGVSGSVSGSDLYMYSGSGSTNGSGGELDLYTGNGNGSGNGGDMYIYGGRGGSSGGAGGSIYIEPGDSYGGAGGVIEITAGLGSTGGGNVTVTAGNVDFGYTANGGTVTIEGGKGGSGGGSAGNALVKGGKAAGASLTGGNVILTGGEPSTVGAFEYTSYVQVNGCKYESEIGGVYLRGGNCNKGTAGCIEIQAGTSKAGYAGDIGIYGGKGTTGTGSVMLTAGSGAVAGTIDLGSNTVMAAGTALYWGNVSTGAGIKYDAVANKWYKRVAGGSWTEF